MRILAHLSDLHFGRIDPVLIEPLLAALVKLKPDIIAVSGDLTQRARRQQFKSARAFLNRLPAAVIVVPGNHDVPLYNLVARFFWPLTQYRRYIARDTEPFYVDDEVAIAGVNTARSLTVKGGRINVRQLARLRQRFGDLDHEVTRVLVTHHPFDVPEGWSRRVVVGRAAMAMRTLASAGVDVCLAGHLHIGRAAVAGNANAHGALLIQAGTATSTRGRGEANSFNVVGIERHEVYVQRYVWVARHRAFEVASSERFRRTRDGWSRA